FQTMVTVASLTFARPGLSPLFCLFFCEFRVLIIGNNLRLWLPLHDQDYHLYFAFFFCEFRVLIIGNNLRLWLHGYCASLTFARAGLSPLFCLFLFLRIPCSYHRQ